MVFLRLLVVAVYFFVLYWGSWQAIAGQNGIKRKAESDYLWATQEDVDRWDRKRSEEDLVDEGSCFDGAREEEPFPYAIIRANGIHKVYMEGLSGPVIFMESLIRKNKCPAIILYKPEKKELEEEKIEEQEVAVVEVTLGAVSPESSEVDVFIEHKSDEPTSHFHCNKPEFNGGIDFLSYGSASNATDTTKNVLLTPSVDQPVLAVDITENKAVNTEFGDTPDPLPLVYPTPVQSGVQSEVQSGVQSAVESAVESASPEPLSGMSDSPMKEEGSDGTGQENGRVNKKATHICHHPGCTKRYRKLSHLKVHLCWHTGEKKYVCTWKECMWKFSRADELSRHMRIHTGAVICRCLSCNQEFSRTDHGKKHLKRHKSEAALKIYSTERRQGEYRDSANLMQTPARKPGRLRRTGSRNKK